MCIRGRTGLAFLLVLTLGLPVSAESSANKGVGAAGLRNGLPPTNMDSFVYEAKGEAEHIYGDEGVDSIPPYFGFTTVHRIDNGIFDRRDAGLTTGHASYMPDAWGADEFIAPPNGEWSRSGANGGNRQLNGGAAALDQADQMQAADAQSGGGAGGGQNIPPPPGPGYGPVWDHGVFMGYMTPAEMALEQQQPGAGMYQFFQSLPDSGLKASFMAEYTGDMSYVAPYLGF